MDQNAWLSWNTRIYDHYSVYRPYNENHKAWHADAHAYRQRQIGPVWGAQTWWNDTHAIWKYHFTHVSAEDPTMICYISSDKKGEKGIYTRLKPGRYLTRFFSGVLKEAQIKYYAEWQIAGTNPALGNYENAVLKFARTEDEIMDVYERGPYSCMVRCFSGPESNPLRTWAAGDLAIAYLEGKAPPSGAPPDRTVIARTVTWPEKKIGSRIYPSTHYWKEDGFIQPEESDAVQLLLRNRLAEQGYRFDTQHEFKGARLKYIPVRGNREILIPAIDMPCRLPDGIYPVKPGREFMQLI